MTSEHLPDHDLRAGRAFVWAWLPGAVDPVVAGVLTQTENRFRTEPVLVFTYARSYLARPEAISLFTPELPLRPGPQDPTSSILGTPGSDWRAGRVRSALPLAGCLRDAAPDTWGRRVLNMRLAADPDVELTELTYLLESGSNRIGALDFQRSSTRYVARGQAASLAQLVEAAELIENGDPIPEDLAAAAGHGTSIGGARPKALLEDNGGHLIAKFSSTGDYRPVVKAEAVGMLLAAKVGIDVAPVRVTRSGGKDVLLVERFDRPADGTRRTVLSMLTILGLSEEEARYASYADIAQTIRSVGWRDVPGSLREMYTRLVFNLCIGNSDDHLRNHAAFWDGHELDLTPAYDLAPQPRSTSVASQAIGITRTGERASQLQVARKVAGEFHLSDADADAIIEHVVSTVRTHFDEVAIEAHLSKAERSRLLGREILNDYIFYDRP